MFWNKEKKEHIDSDEYLILKQLIDRLRLDFTSMELDLQLFTKKLRASKGLQTNKEKEEEKEKDINPVILPI